MQARCFEIDDRGHARPVELVEAVDGWRAKKGTYWIDVERAEYEAAANLLGELQLDRELIDHLFEPGHAARTLPFDEGLFFELPLEITGQPAEVKSAAFVCLDRILVTLRREAYEPSSWIDIEKLKQVDLAGGSTTSLVCALLIELSVIFRQESLALRRTLADLTDRLDADPQAVTLKEIVGLKRKIFDLEAVIEEREAALGALRSVDSFLRGSPDATERIGLALGNTAATSRRIQRLDNRVTALQARYDSAEQEKVNRRLGRLTIISAVFLPLTLIAGIYGMNFEVMPELGYPYAYPLALTGMVVLTMGMLWWFRSRGWMD